MNAIRTALNIILTAALAAAGVYLLSSGSLLWRERWHPEAGLLFSGVSLYLLSVALFFLAGFAGAVTWAWLRGDLPMPRRDRMRPHPAYKGELLVRYWYFIAPALACLVTAFLLAAQVPLLEP